MGIYDRDYYDDQRNDAMDFFRGEGSGIRTLIFANVLVYIFQIAFRGQLEPIFAADSDKIFHGQIWRLFTANFLHDPGGPFHLIFNMLVLWFAGRELEVIYGRERYLKFYFGACIFSMTVWTLAEKAMHPEITSRAIGASGAVMASMMLFTMHFPRRQVIFIFIPMEMWVLMSIYVAVDMLQLVNESAGMNSGQVAFAGHLGGVLYGYLFKTFRIELPDFRKLFKKNRRPTFRVVGRGSDDDSGFWNPDRTGPDRSRTPKVTAGAATKPTVKTSNAKVSPSVFVDQFEKRVDEILSKIAREGQMSLNEEEKKILEEASRRARNRRGN